MQRPCHNLCAFFHILGNWSGPYYLQRWFYYFPEDKTHEHWTSLTNHLWMTRTVWKHFRCLITVASIFLDILESCPFSLSNGSVYDTACSIGAKIKCKTTVSMALIFSESRNQHSRLFLKLLQNWTYLCLISEERSGMLDDNTTVPVLESLWLNHIFYVSLPLVQHLSHLHLWHKGAQCSNSFWNSKAKNSFYIHFCLKHAIWVVIES